MGLTPQADLAAVIMRVGGLDATVHQSHLRGKVQEIYGRLAATEQIKTGRAKLEAAKAAEAKIRRAHGAINKRLAGLRSEVQQAQNSVTDTVIDRFADGTMSGSDIAKLARPFETARAEERILLRAIERLAHDRSFFSRAAIHVAEAELYETFAAALDAESETRLRQTQALAADVVEFEGEVSLPGGAHTVSGALQQMAIQLRQHAARCRKGAEELIVKQQAISVPRGFRTDSE